MDRDSVKDERCAWQGVVVLMNVTRTTIVDIYSR